VKIKPIRTDEDNEAAIARIAELWDKKDQESLDELDVLGTLVNAYEDATIPIGDLDPVDMLQAYMDAQGREQPDLAKLLRSRSRAAEILNRKRPLNLRQIRRLHAEWAIPTDALVGEPRRAKRGKARSKAKARAHSVRERRAS
jgi:HTH-type transcriptional regulator/antitoxin HigA